MKSNFVQWFVPTASAIAALLTPALFAASEAESTMGRQLVKKHADAIVSVELVVARKSGGRGGRGPSETKVEATGTVISKSGMTITSLLQLDQGAAAQAATRGGEPPEIEFKEVKLRLSDNTEVDANVVLKDAELDVAFIMPAGVSTRDYPFIDLSQAAEPLVLGTYFEVGRLGKTMQRVPVVNTVTVIGTLERPRKFAILEDQATPSIPVFDMQGKLLGIGLAYGLNRYVVVPAVDIADMAKQATSAQEKALPIALPPAK